jgi:hypothetical protein
MNDANDLWLAFTRRLREFILSECMGHGVSIVTVRFVARDGHVLQWERPWATRWEPSGSDALLKLLTTSREHDIM